MSSGQKAAFSFLTALILFASFVFVAQTGLMSQLETRFYKQAKINEKQQQLEQISQSCNSYISNILTTLETGDTAYLKSGAVKSYAVQVPSEKDEEERKRLTVELLDSLPGLEKIRLIESNGTNLHYSSIDSDILKQDGLKKVYKKYSDIEKNTGEYPAEILLADSQNPETKILLDSDAKQMIFCVPFNLDLYGNFGTFIFYFNLHGFEQNLINQNAISLGQNLTLYSDEAYKGGFVIDVPKGGATQLYPQIAKNWENANRSLLEPIALSEQGETYCLMTTVSDYGFKVSQIHNIKEFELPGEFIYLIYITVFTTLLLICSLLFNLKRDYVAIIKARIKKVQFGIINEYLENRENIEWSKIAQKLDDRKQELSEEIKKSIGGKSKKYGKEVDAYLDSSWEEIISVLGAQNKKEEPQQQQTNLTGASIEEIRKVIEEVLQTAKLNVAVSPAAVNVVAPFNEEEFDKAQALEAADEVEEIDEIEAVEEIDEIEEIDEAEPVEEIEEVEEIDEAESVEEIEEVEEIDEAEPVEEIEEVEEIDEAEAVEEIEEIEEIDEAEPVEEIEEVEEIDEAEPVEEIEEVEEVNEVADFDTEALIKQVQSLDVPVPGEPNQIAELEEIDELDDVDELEEIEEVEEIEEIEEAEPAEPQPPVIEIIEEKQDNITFSVQNTEDDFFANVDDIFAEELCLGSVYTPKYTSFADDFKFVACTLEFIRPVAETQVLPVEEAVDDFEEIEEAEELLPEELAVLPKEQPYFTMTHFAQNNVPVEELTESVEEVPVDTIIESDGVYSIAQNLEYTDVIQDPSFKALVDSVLK